MRVSGNRQRGFTLIEMVVTTGVLVVAIVLASQVLLEAQLEMNLRTAESSDPNLRFASERLRRDIESATGVAGLDNEWRQGALSLSFSNGRRVRWSFDGVDLLRIVEDPAMEEEVRIVVLREVVSWRWRRVAPRTVDVHLRRLQRQATGPALVGARRSWAPSTETRDVWLRVGLRAGG